MKKLIILLILLIIPFIAFSFDFGFSINNRTILKSNTSEDPANKVPNTVEEKLYAGLWLNHYFDESLYIKVSAHAEIGADYFETTEDYGFLASGDIDSFVLGGKYHLKDSSLTYVDFQVGRQFFSDFSQEVAVTVMDGAKVGFGNTKYQYEIAVGYTGLVYNWSNTIKMGINDVNATQSWSKGITDAAQKTAMDEFSSLHGSPRLLGNFQLRVPELFLGQSLYFNLLGQLDLWPYLSEDNLVKEGDTVKNNEYGSAINTLYAGLGLRGAITSYLYYNAFAYVSTGAYLDIENESKSYQNKAILSGLVGFDLYAYIYEALYSRITFSARYASGDSNKQGKNYFDMTTTGSFNTQFNPLVQQQLNTVFNPLMSNLATLSLSYSFKPFSGFDNIYLQDFMIEASAKSFLRGSSAAISEAFVKTEASTPYLGTELNVMCTLLNISDFSLFLATGVFFPHADAFTANYDKPRLETELNFTIHL